MASGISTFNRFLFRFGRRLDVPDFDVRALLPDASEKESLQSKISAALSLLSSYAPLRYRALERDLPRIWVSATQHLAQCLYDVGICLVRFDYVIAANTTAEKLAMTFVHEGTHARLLRAGFKYREAIRGRVERLCVLSEIVLARRLPASETLVADAERQLVWPDEFWSDEQFRARDMARLEQLGPIARTAGKIAMWIARHLHRRRAA